MMHGQQYVKFHNYSSAWKFFAGKMKVCFACLSAAIREPRYCFFCYC